MFERFIASDGNYIFDVGNAFIYYNPFWLFLFICIVILMIIAFLLLYVWD